MTKRLIVVPMAVAALAFPAGALADGGSQGKAKSPAQQCRAERTQIGADAFKQKYGGKSNAFGKCVSKKAHEQHQQTAAQRSNSGSSTQGDDNGADENEADDNGKAEDSHGQAGDDHGQADESHPGDS